MNTTAIDIDREVGNFTYDIKPYRDSGFGLSEKTIHYISDVKDDPQWVRDFRLKAYQTFLDKPMPTSWATTDLEAIDFSKIRYYLSAQAKTTRSWD